ncbi:MAG TPA: LPD23 domain-containing protein, partial [Croceibacterium sp.]|nr:LPD23 domain-containing protein [Croceibacterium sp.]
MAEKNAMAKGREVAFRASMLPVGNYDDGSVAFPVWPQGAVDAYNAMSRFHRGEPPQPEDAVLAGLVMGGGIAAPRPVGSVGMFGGRLAKTADHAALRKAEEMAAKGAERDAIWHETGWFQGADGKWRFEIDDSGATASRWRKTGPLRKVLKHAELNEAYPDAGKIPVKKTGSKTGISTGADYQPRGDGWFGGWRQPEEIRTSPFADALDPEGRSSRLLHEAQHAIQKREGFARGASRDEYSYADGFNDQHHPRFSHARPAVATYADEMMKRDGVDPRRPDIDYANTPNDRIEAAIDAKIAWEKARRDYEARAYDELNRRAYERSAGEVEAQNVQARQHMTPDERRANPPWATEGLPPERQLLQQWGDLSPVPPPTRRAMPAQPADFVSDGAGGFRATSDPRPVDPTELLPPAPLAARPQPPRIPPTIDEGGNTLFSNAPGAAPVGALSAGNTMPQNFEQAFAELDAALIDLDGDGVPDVAVPQQSVQQPSNAMAGYAQGGQQPQTNAMAQAARYDNTNFPSGGGLPDYGFGPVTQMSKLGVVPGTDGDISNTSRPQEYTAPIAEMTPAPIPGGAAIARALPRVAGLAAGGLGLSAMVSDAGQGSESPLQQLYAQQSSLAARRDEAVRARDREGATGKGPRFQAADAEVRRLEAELSGLNAMISDENRRNSPEYQMEMQRKADELAREQKEKEAATPFRERYPEIAGALPYAGYAASLGLPFAAGAKKNIGSFFPGSYAGRVRSAAGRAEAAVAGSDRNAMATSATELGHLIQNQPTTRNAMADAGAAAAAGGVLGAEAGLIPDVIDYSNANLSDEDRAGTLERLGDLQGHALRIGSGALTGWSGYKAGQILTPKRTPDMGRANAMREAADRGSVAPPPQQPQVITRSSAGTYHGPDGRFISPPR